MRNLYSDSKKYEHANVTEVKFTKSESAMVGTSVSLCLVVKEKDINALFIEDMFKTKVKTGIIYENMTVKSDSAGFKPLG